MNIGDRVEINSGSAMGRTGEIIDDEPNVDETKPEGSMSYLVRLDSQNDDYNDDQWFDDFELKEVKK